MKRMRIAKVAATFAGLVLLAQPAIAAWPDDKAIELVVGFGPGGGTDVMARVMARFMEKRLGNQARIVVINKPGSGGEIAASYIQHAKPDGYTIGFVNVPGYVFLPMYRKTAYDPDQIRLIARVVDDPAILVANRAAGKPQTLGGLVDAAKAAPGTISIGHSGEGTTGHLGMLDLERVAGIELISIPFKGSADAKVSLIGGHVDYVLATTGEVTELSHSGSKISGVAVWAGQRVAGSDVPLTGEQGLDLRISSERGIGGPHGLSDDIARRLEQTISETLKDPAFLEAAKADAPVVAFLPGADWERELKALRERLQPLVPLMK